MRAQIAGYYLLKTKETNLVAIQPFPTTGINHVYNFKFLEFTPGSLRGGFSAKRDKNYPI